LRFSLQDTSIMITITRTVAVMQTLICVSEVNNGFTIGPFNTLELSDYTISCTCEGLVARDTFVSRGDYVTRCDDAIYVAGQVILRITHSTAVRLLNFKVYVIQSYGAISLSDPASTLQSIETTLKKRDNKRDEGE
jgi:hypothetical protein